MAGAQRRLVDVELVGIHRALHDGFAKAVRRGNEDDVAEARVRIEREHDAARADIGANHVLYAGGQRHLCVVEALVHAIGDGAIVEQRREHFVHALEHRVAPAHVEERFLLTGERCVRQVFCRGRRAHRDGDIAPAAHALERFEDLALSRGGNGVARIHWRMRAPALASVSTSSTSSVVERLRDARGEAIVLQEVTIGLRRGREAIRHVDAGVREMADHLAERGVLAADGLDVVSAELGEGNGVALMTTRMSISEVPALDPAPVR